MSAARCTWPGGGTDDGAAEAGSRVLPGQGFYAAGDQALGRFLDNVIGCLAEEWQQAVDQGLGEQDLTIVTRVLEQQGGTP